MILKRALNNLKTPQNHSKNKNNPIEKQMDPNLL
jgi:hypothetical protein